MSKHGKQYEAKGQELELERGTQGRDCQGRAGRTHLRRAVTWSTKGSSLTTWCVKSAGRTIPLCQASEKTLRPTWADKRLDAWVKTCTQCHSESFARAYLEFMDNGTYSGLDKYDEAHEIVHKQYEGGLLTGQKTNRPEPPKPVPEGFEQFFQIYWSKGNNPAAIELKLFEMAEDHLVQLHVVSPTNIGGITYTVGWAAMNRAYVEIMDEDTKLKEKLALQERVAKLERAKRACLTSTARTGRLRSVAWVAACC